MSENSYSTVSTQPVKRFFVDMLTRDIAVEDAILDLLDNCVDGILRSQTVEEGNETPYSGFWAKITVSGESFEIEDNCGGIPWDEHNRAFRMGRPPDELNQPAIAQPLSVGVYGIGMKRAIFKIGTEAVISTQNKDDSYKIPIDRDWINSEDRWDLEVFPDESKSEDGTYIKISSLHNGISERFAANSFTNDLLDKVQSHYAVIIEKGFTVKVNDIEASPKPIKFRFAPIQTKSAIRPYIFKSEEDDVEVFLAVGLREPIPDVEKTIEGQSENQFSSDFAGWTVICNDRVVLYCNRDELTGWGTAGIPRYHTQFIAISGVVEFRGSPAKLPTTTTKRGLDFSSSLYQQVLNKMREGLRLFVDFTNRWKTREDEVKNSIIPLPSISYPALKQEVLRDSAIKDTTSDISFYAVKVGLPGMQYKPKLPTPSNNTTDVRISYSREKEDVFLLAEELLEGFEDIQAKEIPRKVGEASFDFAFNHLFSKDTTDSNK